MATKYQATIKFYIDKGSKMYGDTLSPWLYLEPAHRCCKTKKEIMERIRKEIKRRAKTEQPVVAYRIYKLEEERVEEVYLKDK